eukprot:GFUD01022394.1.p1 GENE.GFUD01022394.1~~GFUD01022394.1.p1  ORF type:complete len:309 (+),score=92.32 GFUD01022394.1:58-927(+)
MDGDSHLESSSGLGYLDPAPTVWNSLTQPGGHHGPVPGEVRGGHHHLQQEERGELEGPQGGAHPPLHQEAGYVHTSNMDGVTEVSDSEFYAMFPSWRPPPHSTQDESEQPQTPTCQLPTSAVQSTLCSPTTPSSSSMVVPRPSVCRRPSAPDNVPSSTRNNTGSSTRINVSPGREHVPLVDGNGRREQVQVVNENGQVTLCDIVTTEENNNPRAKKSKKNEKQRTEDAAALYYKTMMEDQVKLNKLKRKLIRKKIYTEEVKQALMKHNSPVSFGDLPELEESSGDSSSE